MRIKVLHSFPVMKDGAETKPAVGDIISLDDAAAQGYIKLGLAEKATDPDPMEKLLSGVTEAVAKGFAGIQGSGNHPNRSGVSGDQIDAGEQEDDRRKGLADFVRCVVAADCPRSANEFGIQLTAQEAVERLGKVYKSTRTAVKKDLAEGSGPTGGYTVAPTYGDQLMKLAFEKSVVRPYANVKTLPAREGKYPALDQASTPTGGASAYYGGVNMQWTGEAQVRPATEPVFDEIHMITHELAGLTKISRTLLSDSMVPMEAELRSLFSGAIAYAEDRAFLIGDGNAKPTGVLNSAALITYATRSAANKFALADAANMMGTMIPECRPNAVWVLINTLFSQLVQLADSTGRVTYIPNVGSGYGEAKLAMGQLLLFGRPVLFTERLNTLGTAGDVLCCDFSKYIVADTGTLEIEASDQYAFNTNQITFRVIKRVDGKPQIRGPLTMQDGTTQISPFVALHA